MANWWDKLLTDKQKFRLQEPQDASLLDVVANVPNPVGDVASGLLAAQDVSKGNYGTAALNALGLLPFVPSMGGVIKGKLSVDNPHGSWLEGKKEYSSEAGMNKFGTPNRIGTVTGRYDVEQNIPLSVLRGIKGMRGEQDNVRADSIDWLTKNMQETGKLPLADNGKEYAPFITVDQRGIPYVHEGNHRIMVADQLGWDSLPVEIKYFNGGEEMAGILSPQSIAAMPDLPRMKKTKQKK